MNIMFWHCPNNTEMQLWVRIAKASWQDRGVAVRVLLGQPVCMSSLTSKSLASATSGTTATTTSAAPPRPSAPRECFNPVGARKYFVEYHIPGFAEFEPMGSKKIVEIGCGIGTDTVNLAWQLLRADPGGARLSAG
jgi:hypothetical protein